MAPVTGCVAEVVFDLSAIGSAIFLEVELAD